MRNLGVRVGLFFPEFKMEIISLFVLIVTVRNDYFLNKIDTVDLHKLGLTS